MVPQRKPCLVTLSEGRQSRRNLLQHGYNSAMDISSFLRPTSMIIRLALPTDKVVVCGVCKETHFEAKAILHRTCTQCFSELNLDDESVTVANWIRERNQLGSQLNSLRNRTVAVRIEELTGQTDDYGLRQRRFRGILTNKESDIQMKRICEIDILSVTTTVEVGVDLGSLSAVYLSNMPPEILLTTCWKSRA